MKRLLREPLFRFFVLGALLFVVHHLAVDDPRTITVSQGLKAELTRRFRDRTGRAPAPAELESSLRDWKRDEALYREALRAGLDRDDPSVRNVLIEKMNTRMALEAPPGEPSEGELQRWFAAHRDRYETPLRYTLEWVLFATGEPTASEQRDRFLRSAESGADPRFLGKPIFGATLTGAEVRERLGAAAAARVTELPRGRWAPADGARDLLLVRVNEVDGGLPSADDLHARLLIDYANDQRRLAMERGAQAIVARYRFEEGG